MKALAVVVGEFELTRVDGKNGGKIHGEITRNG